MKHCQELAKKPIGEYDSGDLRIMVGQNIGLTFLIPMATQVLEMNILAEGDYYEGDLLENVLRSNTMYWRQNKANWEHMCNLFTKETDELLEFETLELIKESWFELFERFEKIHDHTDNAKASQGNSNGSHLDK